MSVRSYQIFPCKFGQLQVLEWIPAYVNFYGNMILLKKNPVQSNRITIVFFNTTIIFLFVVVVLAQINKKWKSVSLRRYKM